MTILGTDNDDSLFICKWFDRNGKLHSDSFPQDMIEIFTPRPRDNTPAQAKPSYNKPFQHKPFEG